MSINHLGEILTESPLKGTLNTCEVQKLPDFRPITRYISKTIHVTAIVTMER